MLIALTVGPANIVLNTDSIETIQPDGSGCVVHLVSGLKLNLINTSVIQLYNIIKKEQELTK